LTDFSDYAKRCNSISRVQAVWMRIEILRREMAIEAPGFRPR